MSEAAGRIIEAGRALDAEIARRVFGEIVRFVRSARAAGGYVQGFENDDTPVPRYSADLAAAWLIVEHFRNQGRECYVQAKPLGLSFLTEEYDPERRMAYQAHFVDRWAGWPRPGGWPVGHGDSMPLAICRAALVIVGVERPATDTREVGQS